ncbi:MAG: GNAT family N-acetyltransferase [Firmicutes bacterium]|nr:GNAT family N-acetyltransferase [Bacillota bacterium]
MIYSKFTNEYILETAMKQSAIDMNCSENDFRRSENVIVLSKENTKARKYLKLPFECSMVSYGGNIVASVKEEYRDIICSYINRFPQERCFETPGMHVLNCELEKKGLRICFMAEYFLPDTEYFYLYAQKIKNTDFPYELKIMRQSDFSQLYTGTWLNALEEKRKELDIIGMGAYDGGKLIGLAGASSDCTDMWQIGIDVLPEYRRQGIASVLTSRLALEIMKNGKVPFYCAAWSNLKSVRNAVKCGFRPAWIEMTAKSIPFTEDMIKKL